MDLLDLNEYCLIELCRCLEPEAIVNVTETCSKLKNIAEDVIQRRPHRYYSCTVDSFDKEVLAVKTLRKFGNHLTTFHLMIEPQYDYTESSVTELLNAIKDEVTKNLIELSVLSRQCEIPLNILAPIFQHLKVLTLQDVCLQEGCESEIDLPKMCPMLRKLTVGGRINFTPTNRKRFRRLVSLDVTFFPHQMAVFTDNPQLTTLNLRTREPKIRRVDLSVYNQSFLNVKNLHLDVQLIENPSQYLPTLATFPRLGSLDLYSIPPESFVDILKVLETLSRLREIQLQCDVPRAYKEYEKIQDALISVASNMSKLKSFTTVNVDWVATSVIDFVRHAESLIYFDFWSGLDFNYTITPLFIRSLAAIRSLSDNTGVGPLHLKLYKVQNDIRKVFEEPAVANMIKLA